MAKAKATASNEAVINGKRVWFKDRLTMKEGSRLPALLRACNSGNLEDDVAVCTLVIERWEFDGDPSDPAAYEQLDVFGEVLPLCSAVGRYINERMGIPVFGEAGAMRT